MREGGVMGGGATMGHTGTHSECRAAYYAAFLGQPLVLDQSLRVSVCCTAGCDMK
jgi:hypothetical protein